MSELLLEHGAENASLLLGKQPLACVDLANLYVSTRASFATKPLSASPVFAEVRGA
jgi:hypothetical protein